MMKGFLCQKDKNKITFELHKVRCNDVYQQKVGNVSKHELNKMKVSVILAIKKGKW